MSDITEIHLMVNNNNNMSNTFEANREFLDAGSDLVPVIGELLLKADDHHLETWEDTMEKNICETRNVYHNGRIVKETFSDVSPSRPFTICALRG